MKFFKNQRFSRILRFLNIGGPYFGHQISVYQAGTLILPSYLSTVAIEGPRSPPSHAFFFHHFFGEFAKNCIWGEPKIHQKSGEKIKIHQKSERKKLLYTYMNFRRRRFFFRKHLGNHRFPINIYIR